MRIVTTLMAQSLLMLGITSMVAAAGAWGLKPGTVELKTAGPMTFGPDGILIIGDAKAGAVIAIDTEDRSKRGSESNIDVEGLDKRIGRHLGASRVGIVDIAVNPISGNVYVSLTSDGGARIVRVEPTGELSTVGLEKVSNASVELSDLPADAVTGEGRRRRNRRMEAITDIAYSGGRVLVSGLTSSQASSSVRELDFPFSEGSRATNVEIFHGAHGRYEDNSVIRTFVPFNIDGEPSLLAGFTCTPLVKFPIKALEERKVRGTTVAELGNRNRPLDMIVYEQEGNTFLLMANSERGVMKISTKDIERSEGITSKISGTAGQTYKTIESLKNVVQLDKLNESQGVVLVKRDNGSHDMKTIALP